MDGGFWFLNFIEGTESMIDLVPLGIYKGTESIIPFLRNCLLWCTLANGHRKSLRNPSNESKTQKYSIIFFIKFLKLKHYG